MARFFALFLLFIIVFIQCSDQASSPVSPEITFQERNDFIHSVITDQLHIPWQMAFTPDGRILITERNGLIRVIQDGRLQEQPWLDLRDSLRTSSAATVPNSGVTGIAIDPDFASSGFVYIGYSYEAPGDDYDYNRLVRYRENPATGKGEFDTVLIDKMKGSSMHNSAQLKFGPDHKLYWSIGDRHEPASAQDRSDESGSILRLNPDGSIPEDNPFPGSAVYVYGLRDSQGFDWHPENHMMLATEHGPSGNSPEDCCLDEINWIEAGKNYGWPVIRGNEEAPEMQTPLIHSGQGTPLEEYTWAPSGAAFVHTGPWKGSFLFAGLRSQRLWQLVLDENNHVTELNHLLENEYGRVRSVAQDNSGAIYVITSNRDNSHLGTPIQKDFLIKVESGPLYETE